MRYSSTGRRSLADPWPDDPATVPPRLLRPVLTHLVATSRAIPAANFTSAGIALGKGAQMMAKFERAGIRATAPPAAD